MNLTNLARLDERLAAHLQGVALAEEDRLTFSSALLTTPTSHAVFVAAVRALEERQHSATAGIMATVEATPAAVPGLIAAFGWLGAAQLQGTVAHLLRQPAAFARFIAIAACGVHRVDPRVGPSELSGATDASVRARALRVVGEAGLLELAPACMAALADADVDCQFWSAWSAVLLGNRDRALDGLLKASVAEDSSHRWRAFCLALQASNPRDGHAVLQWFAASPDRLRWTIAGSGIVGDPSYVDWLIGRMDDDATARAAGEAFSLITGVDLTASALDRPRPEDLPPNPDSEDDSPDTIPLDDGLPWPRQERVADWWAVNRARFQKGTRYFMGQPVNREHCIHVLKTGYQRQRILAAYYLCLLEPGTPLFNTAAPAWRQQRLLAAM